MGPPTPLMTTLQIPARTTWHGASAGAEPARQNAQPLAEPSSNRGKCSHLAAAAGPCSKQQHAHSTSYKCKPCNHKKENIAQQINCNFGLPGSLILILPRKQDPHLQLVSMCPSFKRAPWGFTLQVPCFQVGSVSSFDLVAFLKKDSKSFFESRLA